MGRLRLLSLVVGPHVLPMTHLEVDIIAGALEAYRNTLKANLASTLLSSDERRNAVKRISVARKITDVISTGNAPHDDAELSRWRADVGSSIRRKVARRVRSTTTIAITHDTDDEREPWEQFVDGNLAEYARGEPMTVDLSRLQCISGFAYVNGIRVAAGSRAIAELPHDVPACGPATYALIGGNPGRHWFQRMRSPGNDELLHVCGNVTTVADLAPRTKALVEVAPGKWAIGIIQVANTDGNGAAGDEEQNRGVGQ